MDHFVPLEPLIHLDQYAQTNDPIAKRDVFRRQFIRWVASSIHPSATGVHLARHCLADGIQVWKVEVVSQSKSNIVWRSRALPALATLGAHSPSAPRTVRRRIARRVVCSQSCRHRPTRSPGWWGWDPTDIWWWMGSNGYMMVDGIQVHKVGAVNQRKTNNVWI
jgi:hypothetical protein